MLFNEKLHHRKSLATIFFSDDALADQLLSPEQVFFASQFASKSTSASELKT